jgi:hypothetical protein
VSPDSYPPLRPDHTGAQRVSLESVRAAMQFFTLKDLDRTRELRDRDVHLIVLDRTWLSQIVHNHALMCALKLPIDLLDELFRELATLVYSGLLYFPDWLVMFRIPEDTSYRKVIRRDGKFFGRNMENMLTASERAIFLRARARAYRALTNVQGLTTVTLSYQAHPLVKVLASTEPPVNLVSPNPRLFFDHCWNLLVNDALKGE